MSINHEIQMLRNQVKTLQTLAQKTQLEERRDMFAAAAMQGTLAHPDFCPIQHGNNTVKNSVELADAMLAELDKEQAND